MILFYSEYCKHCSILLDSIKRHDTKKTIKLVSIDNIRSNKNMDITKLISNVPSLMFLPSKEIISGKAVFDYLLLPNRGYLFTNIINTRDKEKDKEMKDPITSLNSPIPINNLEKEGEPLAFSLGCISSDKFSDITDDNMASININSDKVYRWTTISDNDDSNSNNDLLNKKYEEEKKKTLPTLEELQKQREIL